METPLTITVTPQHLREEWRLALEYSLATGECLTVSILTTDQAAQLPPETALSEFVIKPLGNVLARDAAGCFAPDKARAVLTFDTNGRIAQIA